MSLLCLCLDKAHEPDFKPIKNNHKKVCKIRETSGILAKRENARC